MKGLRESVWCYKEVEDSREGKETGEVGEIRIPKKKGINTVTR